MIENCINFETTLADAVVNTLSAESLAPSVASLPPCPSPANLASRLNLLEAQWSNISEDDNGIACGVFGMEWDEFSSKQLRAICSKVNIKGVRNVKKPDMVQRIVKTHKNRKAYCAMMAYTESKMPANEEEKGHRKQIQCPFCLMNIIFSDKFVEDFAMLGNIASRQLIDTGKASNQQHFWERVTLAFLEAKDTCGILHFAADDLIGIQWHIDPSKIVPHDWKKLRTIWKSVNADYRAAFNRFTQSGTHDNNFYAFCNGKVETYYLRKYLKVRPNTNATVEVDLLEECATSSNGKQTILSSVSKPGKKRGTNELVEAIREYSNSKVGSEVAKQKLFYMEKQELRRQQQEIRLESEHGNKKQRYLSEEWEKMHANICVLRRDLCNVALDNESKREIEEDIAALLRRKNQIATELGLKEIFQKEIFKQK